MLVSDALSTKRSLGLDFLRMLAILLVVFCHSLELVPSTQEGVLLYWWTGFLGVELFYVLSGYLIGSILLEICEQHEQQVSLSRHLPGFWIRRWFRTLPNYYLFLLFDVLVNPHAWAEVLQSLVFMQNFAWPIGTVLPISWSLAIEEWFYLTFPVLLILFAQRIPGARRAFGWACLTYIGVFMAWRTWVSLDPGLNWDVSMRKVVTVRLDSIAYGALVMLAMRQWPDRLRGARHLLLGAGVMGIGIVLVLLTKHLFGQPCSWVTAFLFTLTGLSFAAWLPFAVYQTESKGASSGRTLVATVSIVSYSMYLLHTTVALRFVQTYMKTIDWRLQYLVYMTLCLVLPVFIYNYFERPMTALRNRYAGKTRVEL